MKNQNNNIAIITGYGVCVPGSLNTKDILRNLLDSNSPLSLDKLGEDDVFLSKFSDKELEQVKNLYSNLDISNLDPKILFLFKAIDEAISMSGIDIESLDKNRLSVVFSTCQVALERVESLAKHFILGKEDALNNKDFLGVHYSYLAKYLSKYLKIEKPIVSFSSACAASNNAL